jgi:hypothetical protein
MSWYWWGIVGYAAGSFQVIAMFAWELRKKATPSLTEFRRQITVLQARLARVQDVAIKWSMSTDDGEMGDAERATGDYLLGVLMGEA